MSRRIAVSGVQLEVESHGAGQPLLFLHPGEGLWPRRPWLDALAARFRVIAPHHPGWGNSELPDWIGSVDDLAYLYLDLAAQLGLTGCVLAGASFGGWIAAEIAVRSTQRFSHVVLADPLGIKAGGVTERDIADMHAMTREQFLHLAFADPARGAVDYTQLPDDRLAAIVRGQEAFALFGWKPYMHNPRLRHWLHRIDRPALLLWGERDRIVAPGYAQAWQAAIQGARCERIPDAGHFPHWEQPDEFARRVAAFTQSH
jgi:pimeloyl-ACP methyl ester carboxylesterase